MKAVVSYLPLADEDLLVKIERQGGHHAVCVEHRPTGCYAAASDLPYGWSIEECVRQAKKIVEAQVRLGEQYPDGPPKVRILASQYTMADLKQ